MKTSANTTALTVMPNCVVKLTNVKFTSLCPLCITFSVLYMASSSGLLLTKEGLAENIQAPIIPLPN